MKLDFDKKRGAVFLQKKTIVIISVSIIFGVLVVILGNLLFFSLIGKVFKPEDVPKEEIITEFKMNKKSFVTISDYLTRDEKDICFIILNNNELTDIVNDENGSQTLKISGILNNDAFDKIMKKMHYKYIYEEENTIYFF
mgnify:CR=1 FL=1